MIVDKDPGEDTAVKNEFSDSCDSDRVESISALPGRIFSPPRSSSGDRTTRIHNGENDSKFNGVSQGAIGHLATKNTMHMAKRESIEIYDRESILHKLSHPKNLAAIHDFYRTYESSAGKASAKSSRNSSEFRQLQIEKLREILQSVPDTLLHLLTGRTRPVHCGRSLNQKPDWLDMEKFRRGQKFAQDHFFSSLMTELFTFPALYAFEGLLEPLIVTGNSSTPYTSFKRYLSTAFRFRRWYTQDFWTEGTAAQKDFAIVRAMHAAVTRKLASSTNEEIDAAAAIPYPWCTMRETLLKDFSEACTAPITGQCLYSSERDNPDRPKGINQTEMVLTQWTFTSLITSFPKRVGIHYATDEDLEAYCHLWRCIGYMVGIEDQYNFCRGTLEEIRQRNRHIVETWVKPHLRTITPQWEHMVRCVFTGLGIVLPGVTYEVAILYLSDILGLEMPRLYASLSYKDWISYLLMRFFFNHIIKLPGISGWMNGILNRNLDRAEKFTKEDLESIRIRLCNYPGSKNTDSTKKEIFDR